MAIDPLIARPPSFDYNSLADPLAGYAQGRALRTEMDTDAARRAALANLPRGADGTVNYSELATRLAAAGDMKGLTEFAKLADTRAQQDWNRTYQSGMLDVSRQNANKPQIIGTPETGYWALGPDGRPTAPPQAQPSSRQAGSVSQTVQEPAEPRPIIPPVDRTREQIQQREAEAKRLGMDPNDPQVRGFILTGRRPPEQTLSASDRKAILEADEGVSTGEGVISSLRRAKTLSKNAMGFPGAGYVAQAGSLIGSPVAIDTAELDNLVGTTALSQLKTIFGGNPTEGERKILLELQGSSAKPDAVRQKIYDTAIQMAERRLELKRQQARELREGTYFRPGAGGQQTAPQPQAPIGPVGPEPPQRAQAAPPMDGARQAPDGNWYVQRGDRFFKVEP